MGNGVDNIKLSEKEDYFSVDGDSVVITTEVNRGGFTDFH
jgi:hypothetical protein